MQNPESNTSNVQVLVDLKDPESVVGIMAIANWSKDRVQTVQVWPFVREPINTAAEVPREMPTLRPTKRAGVWLAIIIRTRSLIETYNACP